MIRYITTSKSYTKEKLFVFCLYFVRKNKSISTKSINWCFKLVLKTLPVILSNSVVISGLRVIGDNCILNKKDCTGKHLLFRMLKIINSNLVCFFKISDIFDFYPIFCTQYNLVSMKYFKFRRARVRLL